MSGDRPGGWVSDRVGWVCDQKQVPQGSEVEYLTDEDGDGIAVIVTRWPDGEVPAAPSSTEEEWVEVPGVFVHAHGGDILDVPFGWRRYAASDPYCGRRGHPDDLPLYRRAPAVPEGEA